MSVTGTKIVTVTFNGTRNANTRKLFQYDYGQSYYFKDLELPEVFEVHFSNKPKDGKAKLKELYNNGTPLTVVAKLANPFIQKILLSPIALKTFRNTNIILSPANGIIDLLYYKH